MHIHRLEKWWILIGVSTLILFLIILAINMFAFGFSPPSHKHAIDPAKVYQTPPFNHTGVKQIGPNEYEVVMVAYAFGYTPGEVRIPQNAKVNFVVTSPDVVHGFQIVKTNVNFMVVPGEVSHATHTFNQKGEYLLLCNEYCGSAHHYMAGKIIVE
jgi:cytochrome c oxidase subunit 2